MRLNTFLPVFIFCFCSQVFGTPDDYAQKTSWQCHPHPRWYNNFREQWNAYINFGVVFYNQYYKIYRSTGLNREALKLLKTHLTLGQLDCPKNIVYLKDDNYAKEGTQPMGLAQRLGLSLLNLIGMPMFIFSGDFASVEEEVSIQHAARKAGASCAEYADTEYFPFRFTHPKGEGEDHVDRVDATANFLAFKSEEFSDWNNLFRVGSEEESLKRKTVFYAALKRMLTLDGATNLHCRGGAHDTGIIALALRYLQGGTWIEKFQENKTPYWLMDLHGLHVVRANISNIAEQEYYNHCSGDFRQHNLEMIKALSNEPFFQCLKRKFSCYLNAVSPDAPASVKDCYPFQGFDKEQCKGIVDPEYFNFAIRNELWNECVALHSFMQGAV